MSTTGTKTSGKSTAGDWSNANCYSNLTAAFAAMSTGDTLTINDGTYSGATNQITQNNMPPSGPGTGTGDARFTIIKARNIPGQGATPISTRLKVIFASGFLADNFPGGSGGGGVTQYSTYVKFEGIRFNSQLTTHRNFNHYYFKQCAVQGGLPDGNVAATSISGQNTLLEDTVVFGRGRYGIVFYDQTRETQGDGQLNNICRRCVVRQDWANRDSASQNPIAGVASYYSRGTALLNTVVIDSDSPEYWMENPGELAGSFYQPVDAGNHNLTILGSVAVNNAYSFYTGTTSASGMTISNSYGATLAGGMRIGNSTLSNIGLHDLSTSNFAYRSTTQQNNVGMSAGVLFSSDSSGNSVTSVNGTNTLSVVYKYGVDGTFKNDSGWNTAQGSLWPYPLEDWVKAEMASMDAVINGATMPSATRGFASPTAKRLDGVNPVTLTSYIWECLGNQIPAEIYGGGSSGAITPTINATLNASFQ